jgi:preprotein translocase SecE subunit
VATARADRDRLDGERAGRDRTDGERAGHEPELDAEEFENTPGPIDHAAPDVELAEAQLARRRPAQAGTDDDEDGGPEDDEDSAVGELAPASATAPASRGGTVHRLITFLQGSWRELQRVQWPDRRQVMQATGVVIGFVIVAGLYLGLADTVAGKLVNLILK